MNDISTARMLGAVASGKDLGEFGKCPTCKKYDWTNTHQCAPKWQAIRPDCDDEDEPDTVRCNGDADDAACAFAALHFSDWEYPSEVEIWVRKNEDEPWSKFDISVEPVPSFTATRKEQV